MSKLLMTSDKTITEISFESGYNNIYYFYCVWCVTLAPRRDTRENKLDWKQTETRFDSALPTAWSISKKIRSIHPIHDNDEAALDTVAGSDRCMDRLWVRADPLGDRQP